MTTFCRIVLTVVSCTIDPATPAPTPADAVAIFRASSPPFQPMSAIEPLPWYVDAPIAYDRDWPLAGSFVPTPRADPTWAPTMRRLDGTSLWDPIAVYGFVPHGRGLWYGQSNRVYQGVYGRSPRSVVPGVRTTAGTERHGGPAPSSAGGRDLQGGRAGVGGAPVTRRR